jgi:tRNA(Ile2) C34 agmatinyltransferase TiaS
MEENKNKDYEKLSKCEKGGYHSLWKEGDMKDFRCRKCNKFFNEFDAILMHRE